MKRKFIQQHKISITTNNTMSNTIINNFNKWISNSPALKALPHQQKGFQWCAQREDKATQHKGGILADEMGLGKTVLMLGCMVANKVNNTLIVVPPALIEQWIDAIESFAPEFIVGHTNKKGVKVWKVKFKNAYYCPNATINILSGKNAISPFELNRNTVWVASYGTIATRKNEKWSCPLWKHKWDRIIFDEAHHLRTRNKHNYKGAKKLFEQNPQCIKWFVTGTPIQNYTKDYHSLVSLLGTTDYEFNRAKEFVLQRTKQEVGIKMPRKNVSIIDIQFENENELYVAKQLHSRLGFSNVTVENVDQVMGLFEGRGIFPLMTACRQMTTCPSMLSTRLLAQMLEYQLDPSDFPFAHYSSKLSIIKEYLVERKRENKALVFCHYHAEMDQLERMLKNSGLTVSKLNGKTKNKDKKNLLLHNHTHYQKLLLNRKVGSSDLVNKIMSYLTPDVLLIQIKSGCEGLNLQNYNDVYFTSPHWNPAVEDQAVARVHRIGQTKPVNVYHFISTFDDDNSWTIDQLSISIQDIKRRRMAELKENSCNNDTI